MKVLDPKPQEFVQIRRGGARIWAKVLEKLPMGGMRLRCDSHSNDPAAPKFGEVFDAPADETILDRVRFN